MNIYILRQSASTYETRAVSQAALMRDLVCRIAEPASLVDHCAALRIGRALPVGSVEYVRAALQAARIPEPANLTYPAALFPFLGRRVRLQTAGTLNCRLFVKPTTTKLFNGFVFDPTTSEAELDEHDREERQRLLALPPETEVWASTLVEFVSEWRYYVLAGRIRGCARYDPHGAEDAPAPSSVVTQNAVRTLNQSCNQPFYGALDMGVLSDGRTVLVEANDAYALGLYRGGLEPGEYLNLLAQRWLQICDGFHDELTGPKLSQGPAADRCVTQATQKPSNPVKTEPMVPRRYT